MLFFFELTPIFLSVNMATRSKNISTTCMAVQQTRLKGKACPVGACYDQLPTSIDSLWLAVRVMPEVC